MLKRLPFPLDRDHIKAMTQENQNPKPDQPASEATTPEPQEIGGRKGPEPTRYGDWEIGGKCVDF